MGDTVTIGAVYADEINALGEEIDALATVAELVMYDDLLSSVRSQATVMLDNYPEVVEWEGPRDREGRAIHPNYTYRTLALEGPNGYGVSIQYGRDGKTARQPMLLDYVDEYGRPWLLNHDPELHGDAEHYNIPDADKLREIEFSLERKYLLVAEVDTLLRGTSQSGTMERPTSNGIRYYTAREISGIDGQRVTYLEERVVERGVISWNRWIIDGEEHVQGAPNEYFQVVDDVEDLRRLKGALSI